MTTEQLMMSLMGVLVLIIGYFLVQTMNDLRFNIRKTTKVEGELALLKQESASNIILLEQKTTSKHNSLEEKLDELKDSIKELTTEIKVLNKGK